MSVVPLFLGLVGCFGGGEPAAPEVVPEEAPAAAAPVPEPAERNVYVIGETLLRKIASDDKKIDDPNGGTTKVSNWVATLYRSEQVTIVDEDGDWTRVRASDGSEGWLKADRLVPADHPVATVYEAGKVFQRPDLLTLDTARKIEPGSLVFVLQTRAQFSEIDFPRSGYNSTRAWALTNELVTTPEDVDAAKLVQKVQQLRAKNDPSAAELEALARNQFGTSPLISLLDVPAAAPPEGVPTDVPPAAPVVP